MLYEPDEVVFVVTETNKHGLLPAKIVDKSSFGTYRIRIYGEKNDNFASEYSIRKFTNELIEIYK